MLPAEVKSISAQTAAVWEADGLRLLEVRANSKKVQILFSVTPQVSPVFFCMRVKGRIQYACRQAGCAVDFKRNFAFRSVGENTSAVVQQYIQNQAFKEECADPRFRIALEAFTSVSHDRILTEPSKSGSGLYWYDLHVVLVTVHRFRLTDTETLGRIHHTAATVAEELGCAMAAISVLPDHVHLALRGALECSPEKIAVAFQNALAQAAGCRAWSDEYYLGTFTDYDLGAIRSSVSRSRML